MNAHGDLGILVAVVDMGSFTAAAKALGASTSYVSRRIKALEDELGVRLLERTTRRVRPTVAGQEYRDRVAPLLEGLDEAARAAVLQRAEPRGVLRLAAPTTFARRYLTQPIAAFCTRWPELRVEASYSDRTVDLVADGFDLAIRGVKRVDENLVARRILGFAGVVVASPDYLQRRGRPLHPCDLEAHACLVNTGLRTMPGWVFSRGGKTVHVDVQGPLHCDDGDALVAAAAAGMGICFEPEFLVAGALRSGAVVPLLTDWDPYEGALFAVYPTRRYLPVKVRLFIDHLVACWGEAPWNHDG